MSREQTLSKSISAKYLQGRLERILHKINQEGDFRASILSTLDGFSVAAVLSEFDDVVISAISSIVQEVSKRAEVYIGFKRMDEVSLVDDDKFRLVCREFEVGGRHFILSVIVPPYKTYRRLTNTAIREIEKILPGQREKG